MLPQTKSLYNIREDHLSLLKQIEEADGELTPEMEKALALTADEFQDKAISYAYVVKGFDDTEAAIEREIERLTALKEKATKRAEQFKQRLSEAMEQFGVEKITGPTITLSFRKSEAVEITDETKLPAVFIHSKVVHSISRVSIKNALKEGVQVPGAKLVQRRNLQIK